MTEINIPLTLMRDPAAASDDALGSATSVVEYQAGEQCLLIGDPDQVLAWLPRLSGLTVTVLSLAHDHPEYERKLTDAGIRVYLGQQAELTGHLGRFSLVLTGASRQAVTPAAVTGAEHFDMVIDAHQRALIDASLPPFGYHRVSDEVSLEQALSSAPELVGEFEKPKYFSYSADICAHQRSKVSGCSRCVDVCATRAITSDGDGISVDPFLCQGCGSCAAVCPSGAIKYAYPRLREAIVESRQLLEARAAEVAAVVDTLVLYACDDEVLSAAVDDQPGVRSEVSVESHIQSQLPPSALGVNVEEVTAYGLDYWLAMLAHGISRIVVVTHTASARVDPDGQAALQQQGTVLQQLLAGVGGNSAAITAFPIVSLCALDAGDGLQQHLQSSAEAAASSPLVSIEKAAFEPWNDKRRVIRLSLDHLVEQLGPSQPVVALPPASPFGRIEVDADKCTLCMACVSQCPAKALQDGSQLPQLKFIESNCVQCGICASSCPEAAIELTPRYLYDSVAARDIQTLHEEVPFNCVICHKPFATHKIINSMQEKLAGHWMFSDEKARRRLKMCEDCRVRDMFADNMDGIDVHKR